MTPEEEALIKKYLDKEKRDKNYRKDYYERNKARIKEYHRERSRMVSELLHERKAQRTSREYGAPPVVILGLSQSQLDSLHLLLSALEDEGKLGSEHLKVVLTRLDDMKTNPWDYQLPEDDKEGETKGEDGTIEGDPKA